MNLGRTVFEFMENVNAALAEGKQIVHDEQIRRDVEESYECKQRNFNKKQTNNLPDLINLIEDYVKLRIYIAEKKPYYKEAFRILEPSDWTKKQDAQNGLIENLEHFLHYGEIIQR
jgi:hypothetical protein